MQVSSTLMSRFQGVSKVTTTAFRPRECENSHQISGLYATIRKAGGVLMLVYSESPKCQVALVFAPLK